MMNVQPVLCGGNGKTSDLQLVVSESHERISVFLGVALLEQVPCTPELLQYKMLIGRAVNAGWRLNELAETFGHDPRTMKRWAAALLSEDMDLMVQVFGGRGANGKMTVAEVRYAKNRYNALRGVIRNYRQVILGELFDLFGKRVSGETLRRLFREADRQNAERLDRTKKAPADELTGTEAARPVAATDCGGEALVKGAACEPFSGEPIKATGCVFEPDSCLDAKPTRNQSPDSAAVWPPVLDDLSVGSRPIGLHHAGMILFALALELFCRFRPFARGLQTQWIGQVLQGAVNIERSRLITAADLACFTGSVLAGSDPQRKALHRLASQETVIDVYKANARLVDDGPGRGRNFYYDPHSKKYNGMEKILKDWCGNIHGVAKLMHIDMIHSESGRPCFAQHYSPYYDLRERFFMTIEQFDALFEPGQRSGRLFVLDRGIYGLDALRRFERDHVLTWEKGCKGDDWDDKKPDVVFQRTRARNHAGDLRLYRFECRQEPWQRDPRMRRILVRATNPKGRVLSVSILCSDPDISVERAVWLMFNRWVQENDFKYLDRHFGLSQLTSYASKAVAEEADQLRDMPVDSPEYRELKKLRREAENDLAKKLLRREETADRLEQAGRQISELKQRRKMIAEKLNEQAKLLRRTDGRSATRCLGKSAETLAVSAAYRRELQAARRKSDTLGKRLEHADRAVAELKKRRNALEAKLAKAIRSQSRVQLLIDNHYRLLDTRCKELLDALRITASNMFASLMTVFRPIYKNYRNDHLMLRQLTRADGFLQRIDGTLHVRLWLAGRFQPWQINAFKVFLAEITDRINDARDPNLDKIRITLLDGPPKL